MRNPDKLQRTIRVRCDLDNRGYHDLVYTVEGTVKGDHPEAAADAAVRLELVVDCHTTAKCLRRGSWVLSQGFTPHIVHCYTCHADVMPLDRLQQTCPICNHLIDETTERMA